jgi:hypothetical protein
MESTARYVRLVGIRGESTASPIGFATIDARYSPLKVRRGISLRDPSGGVDFAQEARCALLSVVQCRNPRHRDHPKSLFL